MSILSFVLLAVLGADQEIPKNVQSFFQAEDANRAGHPKRVAAELAIARRMKNTVRIAELNESLKNPSAADLAPEFPRPFAVGGIGKFPESRVKIESIADKNT